MERTHQSAKRKKTREKMRNGKKEVLVRKN